MAAAAHAGTIHVPKDQPTIQAGVDAAADGDTILISGGTYSEAVVISGRSGLLLSAKGKVVINVVGASPGIAIDTSSDLELDGLLFTDGSGDALAITASDNIVVRKCRFQDCFGDGVHGDAVSHLLLDHCTFRNIGDTAVGLPGKTGENDCDQFTVTHCKVLDPPANSLGMRLDGDDGVMEDNVVDASGSAVFYGRSSAVGGTVSGNHVTGGTFLVLSPSVQITGNVLIASRVDVQAASATVQDNTCKGSGELVSLATTASSCVVSGNHLALQDDAVGIAATSLTSGQINGNVIKGKVRKGIDLFDCLVLLVNGNSIAKASDTGVLISACATITADSDVLKSCATGIRFDDSSSNVLISNSSIKGSQGDGLLVEGDSGSVIGNVIKGSKGNGVHLAFQASGNTLGGNVAKGSKGFDLLDESGGANTIQPDNDFGTTSP